MVIDEARKRIDGLDRGPAAAMMLGAVCHDLGKPATTAVIDGRIRSPGPRRGRRGARDGAARSLERAHARRLRRAPGRARPRRASPEAERRSEVADAGQRRRVSPAGAEGRPRAARAVRQGRLPRPRRRFRLLGDGLVSRPRPGARRRAPGPGAASCSAATSSNSAWPPGPEWARSSGKSTKGNWTGRSRRWSEGLVVARVHPIDCADSGLDPGRSTDSGRTLD